MFASTNFPSYLSSGEPEKYQNVKIFESTNPINFPSNDDLSIDYLTMEKISTVLNKKNVLEKVCKKSGIELQVRDLLTLKPMEKLNGEIIECFLKETASTVEVEVDIFSTFFSTVIMREDGVAAAKKTFRKQLSKLESKKIILFPIHYAKKDPWTLAVKYSSSDILFYYDSLFMEEPKEMLDKIIEVLQSSKIDVSGTRYVEDAPKQLNGVDCGMFVCCTGYHLLKEENLTYHQGMILEYRKFVLARLLDDRADMQIPNVNRFREPFLFSELFEIDDDDDVVDAEEIGDDVIVDDADHETSEDPGVCTVRNKMESLNMVDECSNNNNITTKIPMKSIPVVNEVVIGCVQNGFSNLCLKDPVMKRMKVTEIELMKLREGQEPFVDVDVDGNEFTQNLFNDWRRSLKLREILTILGGNAWDIIENEAKSNPNLILGWINKVSVIPKDRSPRHFSFGSKINYQKIKAIMEKIYYPMKIQDPHLTFHHAHQKRRRQRRQPY